jgi:hypothetical protein
LPNAGPLVGPVVLSELMFFPTPSQGTNDNVLDEFIELQNLLPLSQPLHDPLRPTNTWRIDGGVHFAFPAASILDPAEVVLVVSFNPNTDIAALAAFRIRYGVSPNVRCFGPYDGRLNNSAGTVRLLMPDPPQPSPHPDAGVIPYVLVETIQYRATAPWPQSAAGTGASLQRLSADLYANDPLHWITAQPAPGIPAPANLPLDSDDDGLPDTWERQHFGPINLTLISPADDPDGDGLSNAGEFAAGTIPTDPTSTLALDPPILDPGGWRLQFAAVAGRSYNVEVRSSLSQGLWITLVEVPAVAANTTVEILDPAPQGDTRYYRLRLP